MELANTHTQNNGRAQNLCTFFFLFLFLFQATDRQITTINESFIHIRFLSLVLACPMCVEECRVDLGLGAAGQPVQSTAVVTKGDS